MFQGVKKMDPKEDHTEGWIKQGLWKYQVIYLLTTSRQKNNKWIGSFRKKAF